jgi:hypothetical protein
VLCTAGLWLLALMFRKKQKVENGKQNSDLTNPISAVQHFKFQYFALPLALIIWLLVVEFGVEMWYRVRESHLKFTPNWSVAFPITNPTFRTVPIYETTAEALRFDEGREAAWEETEGGHYSAFYATWFPARSRGTWQSGTPLKSVWRLVVARWYRARIWSFGTCMAPFYQRKATSSKPTPGHFTLSIAVGRGVSTLETTWRTRAAASI